MCEPTWILASFQSTSDPFIQILPVPGKAISRSFGSILYGAGTGARMSRIQATETRRHGDLMYFLYFVAPCLRASVAPGPATDVPPRKGTSRCAPGAAFGRG